MHMRIEYLVIAMLVFGASSAAFGQPGNGRHGASAGTPDLHRATSPIIDA